MANNDTNIESIRQTQYNRTQTEYQFFPEEYFTGADVTIYFGDVWVDEITGLQFSLTENVKPIYGYASHTWDAVARGTRIVQGTFRVAFKEAGYLNTILDHLGQMKENAQPRLAYLMGDQPVPEWLGGVKQNIEDLLGGYHGGSTQAPAKTETEEFLDEYEWDTLKLGDTDSSKPNKANRNRHGSTGSITQLQKRLMELKFTWPAINFNWTKGSKVPIHPMAKQRLNNPTDFYMLERYDAKENTICPPSEKGKYNVANPEEAQLQQRLDDYPGLTGKNMGGHGGRYDGKYGDLVTEGVKFFQQLAGVSDGSNGRWVSSKTKAELEKGLVAHGTFDVPTKVAVMLFQKSKGLKQTGIVDDATRKALSPKGTRSKTVPGQSTARLDMVSEPRMTQYEKEVWGRHFSADEDQGSNTFFYHRMRGANYLQEHGFDIFINYGAYPENVVRWKGQMAGQIIGSPVNFNTTVKAIRNVQFTSIGQILDSSGNPIEEVYEFIAKDLD